MLFLVYLADHLPRVQLHFTVLIGQLHISMNEHNRYERPLLRPCLRTFGLRFMGALLIYFGLVRVKKQEIGCGGIWCNSKEEWHSALKKVALDPPRIGNKTMLQEYWMAFMHCLPAGAQASDPLRRILVRAGPLPLPPLEVTGMHSCGCLISRRMHELGRNLVPTSWQKPRYHPVAARHRKLGNELGKEL
ncbi:hypothetical protein POTOM_045753 [Populus tomentosa]|uniref:Uncharacterized protein n=1 Tax=Populus tomentosa TaxID=118781 RepID=A0A8X7YIC3_POPTO|nr:hypothetical protein POTOM_045753 [Populus tomentosa]